MYNLEYELRKYFSPGAIVPSYGGLDRVISFDWRDGDWRVTVQAVRADGSNDPRWPMPRMHCTQPENLALILPQF